MNERKPWRVLFVDKRRQRHDIYDHNCSLDGAAHFGSIDTDPSCLADGVVGEESVRESLLNLGDEGGGQERCWEAEEKVGRGCRRQSNEWRMVRGGSL